MYYSRPPYIIFRDYPDFGYLTDNRNYGYDTAAKSSLKVGDRILDKVGSIIYSVLSDKPKPLEEIVASVSEQFNDVPYEVILRDIELFLRELYSECFVEVSDDLDNHSNLNHFSYDNTIPNVFEEFKVTEKMVKYDHDWFERYRLQRLHIGVSWACNERCVHCYFPNNRRIGIMSKSMFDTILMQAKEKNVINITLSGGEPMLNSNLLYFIQRCRENNFSINLLSNLTLLTAKILDEFKVTPLLSIQTSLYSMDEQVHDSITQQKGSFRKTKQAIESLHQHNIPLQINCPVMKQNKDSYQEVLEWAKSMNIEASADYMLFGCFDGSCQNLQYRLDLSEIESLVERAKTEDIQPRPIINKDNVCTVCQSSLCISPVGDVYPCEGWQSFILGNINEQSLCDIWENSDSTNRLRHLSIKELPKCASCENRTFCTICLIRNANESKNLNFRDVNPFFCSVANLKRKSFLRRIN